MRGTRSCSTRRECTHTWVFKTRDGTNSFWTSGPSPIPRCLGILVHHIAATQIAAMHNADFLQQKWFPLFYSVIAVMAHPVLQHRHVNFLTSRALPFGLCFHFSFRHNGFLYKTTEFHQESQRRMAIANATQTQRCGALSWACPYYREAPLSHSAWNWRWPESDLKMT